MKDSITKYFELVAERPDLFTPSSRIPLCLDEAEIRTFAQTTGKPVGVVYDNAPYYMVVADLCMNGEKRYTYARVIYCHAQSNGVVVLPFRRHAGQLQFGLLSIFRHPPRMESGGEFPRGFAESLTPAENAVKELKEEIGAQVEIQNLTYLGDLQADTGLSSGRVQIFSARVDDTNLPTENYEGIHGLHWVTEAELITLIDSGIITDGFTLGAYAKYCCRFHG